MDSPQSTSLPALPVKRAKWRKLKLLGAAILTLLLAFMLLLLLIPTHSTQFAWLTPIELDHITRPGPVTRLKYKLMILTAPLWKSYWRNRPSIAIDSTIWSVPAGDAAQLGLGPPLTTNSSGFHAWLLSPSELKTLKQLLKKTSGASIETSPRMQTSDDSQAMMSMGNTVPLPPAGKPTFVGLAVNMTPKIFPHSVRLALNITSTALPTPTSGDSPTIETNIAICCVAPVPRTGALVLDAGNNKEAPGKTRWIVISATVVDAKGNPLPP